MPRRESFIPDDGGAEGIGPPERFSFAHTNLHNSAFFASPTAHEEDPELIELERRLNEEVDEDFFEEPRKFNTLQRVIDVLGLQMIDDATFLSSSNQSGGAAELGKNPAYRQLKAQQQIVEGAIEHMAVIHCADLNGSVIQVGRVAKQFSEAVSKVRSLRKQVRDIQDTLGAGAAPSGGGGATSQSNSSENNNNKANAAPSSSPSRNNAAANAHAAASMSLRELWIKKLECEATLSLLSKLDVIRAAPTKFDMLIKPPVVRIGAAVNCLSDALQTMFSDDVAQVQALHKIMEQLMLRKQKAEEIIWDTLHDVIFLRTGNGLAPNDDDGKTRDSSSFHNHAKSSQQSIVSSDSRRSGSRAGGGGSRVSFGGSAGNQSRRYRSSKGHNHSHHPDGMVNPFVGRNGARRFAVDEELDDDEDDDHSVGSTGSGASLFSMEDSERGGGGGMGSDAASIGAGTQVTSTTGAASINKNKKRMMIPLPMIEAELDLEEDERRCLEEIALSSLTSQKNLHAQQHASSSYHQSTRSGGGGNRSNHRQRQLPRYADPVLALRILVECMAKLKRLDDVERVLAEGLEREIQRIIQREQARTFYRLEKKRTAVSLTRTSAATDNNDNNSLHEFRQHLTGILSAFGCVMIRLSHLAEILRHRVAGDKELMQKMGGSPSSIMRPVLSTAYDIMQREIKTFLKACLREPETSRIDPMDQSRGKGMRAYESGLFSLGIVETNEQPGLGSVAAGATRNHVMEMATAKFVSNILLPMTRTEPQVRYALLFRRSIAKWTSENEALKLELAHLTYEDTTSPSFFVSPEQPTIEFLDDVIQHELLPVLQEEAVNGTVKGLERRDAFDPVLDRTLYSRNPNSNEPHDVDMCKACQAMYDSTGPLFLALHRLPRGGEMYLPLVAVLEHVMLTFTSRVKQQIEKICRNKTAYMILLADEDNPGSLASMSERRRPFALLLRAYADGDMFGSTPSSAAGADELGKQGGGLMPLTPPASDTTPRSSVGDMKVDTPLEELADGVEGEEIAMELELKSLKPYFQFDREAAASKQQPPITVCNDEELMNASCLGHSLLKLASLLDSRLKVRGGGSYKQTLTSTRTLQEAIKTIKRHGIQMAKFCRYDILMQTCLKMSKVPLSSVIVARDAVRIPSSVNDLGEVLMGASDNLREAAGNAIAAYAFSSLEQYIPYCLMQAVRVVAAGKGVVTKNPLTMNGIEAMDRSGSVLYRDLKGATSFDNSFWDVELAAVSFERSASFIAMMELEMEELIAYYSANQDDFSEDDFKLMFAMTGPRRRGDINQYQILKKQEQRRLK